MWNATRGGRLAPAYGPTPCSAAGFGAPLSSTLDQASMAPTCGTTVTPARGKTVGAVNAAGCSAGAWLR
eukprot:5086154-Prymnesium_polylepis.2